ncbi:MAG: putative methyl-accepting chemotaxis sensory transducer, partial [Enterovirga sp.]|nr:putative methyl-accepting chemotaxis sensory transducer [Enterovirga sp.]
PAGKAAQAAPEPAPSPPANEDRPPKGNQAASPAPRPPARTAAGPERPPREVQREAPKADPAKPEPSPAQPARPARTLPADPAAAFASLAAEGVIPDARTLPELYHNARVLEAKGDRPGALAAYAAAAALPGDAVDLHLRHASLLRAVRGPAAARQAYAALAKSNPSPAVALVSAIGLDGEERGARLEAVAAAQPGAGPADFVLAESLLDRRAGGPTLTERRLAFDALDRFLEAAAAGVLARSFVDRTFLESWLDAARRRRGEIESAFASSPTRPSAAFSRTGSGWLARFTLPEAATAVSVRVGERGEVQQIGPARGEEARPGQPAAEPAIELPANSPRTTLYLSYRDRADREAGPFPLTFDPAAAEVAGGRTALERYPESWVTFRPDIPDLLSFAGLVSHRCAIARARIGFGDEPPNQPLPLPPCDSTGPATMPAGAALLSLPEGTAMVRVQLTYADGSESPVRSFQRP